MSEMNEKYAGYREVFTIEISGPDINQGFVTGYITDSNPTIRLKTTIGFRNYAWNRFEVHQIESLVEGLLAAKNAAIDLMVEPAKAKAVVPVVPAKAKAVVPVVPAKAKAVVPAKAKAVVPVVPVVPAKAKTKAVVPVVPAKAKTKAVIPVVPAKPVEPDRITIIENQVTNLTKLLTGFINQFKE